MREHDTLNSYHTKTTLYHTYTIHLSHLQDTGNAHLAYNTQCGSGGEGFEDKAITRTTPRCLEHVCITCLHILEYRTVERDAARTHKWRGSITLVEQNMPPQQARQAQQER